MTYFAQHYDAFRYPLQSNGSSGFRLAQLGAIHASAAHFANRATPGIITMPTGSGKTAVLIAAAFVLRARRVLIIAPGRLVREQIADEVASLVTLRQAGAISSEIPPPKVFSVKSRVKTAETWEAMRDFDVVVATVQSISPEYEITPVPPADLFDLVLVDEAHHSPARTWQSVLDHFASSQRLLFTATPFRQDQREIKGRFIFTYDLRKAFEDGVFGEIKYQPVTPVPGQTHDAAIAVSAERQYQSDKTANYQHRVMVRTDSRKRAAELFEVYKNHTSLRLKIITGDKSLRYVKSVIEQLEAGELDGIICVNMLGEGFNFPSLKIAAIHSPHRSLSVTLQFIGRFARTTGRNLGPATFLAIPSEIEIEAERLYDSRSVWQEMIQNLSATRVHQEAETREVLESFAPSELTAPDLTDLSLYVLEPYYHVKIYQLDQAIDIRTPVAYPEAFQVVYQAVSEAHNASIYVTRETTLPRWTSDDRLSCVQPDLFIFFQDVQSKLLFICASRRSEGLYKHLSDSFVGANPKALPLVRLNRALNDITAPEFFNVGMRNRVTSNTTESYRIVAGSNADKGIGRSDARLYHRGHAFGRGSDDGEMVTIGLSSASKIWSNKSSKLPDLIEWCEKLASRINSDRNPITGSGLDYLDVGEEISALPDGIVAVDWRHSIYKSPPTIRYDSSSSQVVAQLLDCDLNVETSDPLSGRVILALRHSGGLEYRATFSFETERFFEPLTQNETLVTIDRERESLTIIDFLNSEMPLFYTSDLSLIDGYSLLRAPTEPNPPFDDSLIETLDWAAARIDIGREFGVASRGLLSIHEGMKNQLRQSTNQIVYYDHGTGEIADFVAVDKEGSKLIIRFFHCKAASGSSAGHRVADVYEVTAQAVKSITWALKQKVLSHVRRRYNQRIGSHIFVKGDLDTLEQLLTDATAAQIEFEFITVQPGLQKHGLPDALANIFAAASDHLVRGGFRPLKVIASP